MSGAPWSPTATVLPNGLAIHEINRYETSFLYEEIFGARVYLRHGLRIGPGAFVIDGGANIGLFSLFCLEEAPDATIVAFEPTPHCAACYRHNLREAHAQVRLIEGALVDRPGPQRFTYYPHYSIMSGLKADRSDDAEVLHKGAAAQLGVDGDDPRARKLVDPLVADKLEQAVAFTCSGHTLGATIDEVGFPRVDLLKLDVEKAEGLVLGGLEDRHWPLVRQAVIEVHDQGDGEREAIEAMFTDRGFDVAVSSGSLDASGICNLYARRR
jgi:FkbM family methyltransferase